MVSVCLPSDALSQYLPSYLGFSYLGRGVPLHGCSSKVQPLLLTLDEGYLLMATSSVLERGVAPLGLPVPTQPQLLGVGLLLLAAAPDLGCVVRGSRREKLPTSKVRGSCREEVPRVQGQGWRRECQAATEQEQLLRGATPNPRPGAAAGRRCPLSKVRSSGCTLLKQP